jgi:P-type Ca2+ transporter type 2C
MVFTTLALLQLGHALAVRSERESFFTLGARSNPFLLALVLVASTAALGVVELE